MKKMKKFFVFICCIITVATFLLAGCGPDTGSDSDTPVLKNFKCRGSAAVGSGSVIESVRAFSSSVEMYNFEIQPDSYFVAKEKIVLEITIENPEGYSISRFKINGTAFTSGSFTTLPIVIGSLDTVINVEVTLPSETVTYNLSDIKYIAERNVSGNNSGEKSVTMPEQLKSITVNVLEDRIYSTNGVVYQIVGDGIYVYGHKLMLGRGYWTGASSSNKREKISLTVPENIEGINVTYVC